MSAQINHTSLAMKASRRMRRVKHKRKNSRVICHHLKMMLEARKPYLASIKTENEMPAFGIERDISGGNKIPQYLSVEKQYTLTLSY